MMPSKIKKNGSNKLNLKCKIKFSRKSPKSPVYLTDFSHGKLRSTHRDGVKFHSYHKMEGNDEKRILVADNDRVQYSGASFGADADERNGSIRYMVGVRRKGKMKTCHSLFFHLKPIISEPLKIADDSKKFLNKRSYQEIRDELTSNFGSKLGIRAMSSRLKYATDVNTATPTAHELADLSLEDDVKPSVNMTLKSIPSTDVIPPRDINALDSTEVYSINDIINEEEFDALKSDADALKATTDGEIMQWKTDKFYCNYVMSHLENEELDPKTARMLVYYNYLISASKLTFKEIRRKDPIPDIPEPYKQNILQRYTVSTINEHGRPIRSFPRQMKDKLLAYTLVLALFIDDYSVNLDLVQSDIKIALLKLSKVAQVLGCHIVNRKVDDSMVKFADLKLPLYNPTQKQYMRKPNFGK